MKSNHTEPRARKLTLALRAALATLAAASMLPAAMADDAVQALTQPTNTIDIGGIYVQHASDLFGQYNGLENSGASLLGDFSLRGGNAYGQQPGTKTWNVDGANLGTTSRSLGAGMADQGTWSLGLSFDQLRNYGGDSLTTNPGSFQTPLLGAPGSDVFTLPSNFGKVSTTGVGTQAITPNSSQAPFFHTDHLYTERDTTRLDASHKLNDNLNVTFNWTSIHETGSILASAVTDSLTGATFTGTNSSIGGQKNLGLPYPTDYQTNNFNLALNWSGQQGFFTGAFFGSIFHDDYNSVWYANPYSTTAATGAAANSAYPMNAQSTPPSNTDNELRLSGGWHFTPETQLVGGYTYGRNTQNMAFGGYEPLEIGTSMTNMGLPLPENSLNGLVINQHANWSLTNRASRDLTLSAGMIYSKRDNQTPVELFQFQAPDSGPSGDWFSLYNAPMSNSKLDTNVAADWRFASSQRLHVSAQDEKIERWCDSSVLNGLTVEGATGTGTSQGCAAVPESREDTVAAEYFLRHGDNLNFHTGVSYANRTATLNQYYYNPITAATSDESDKAGWVAFFDASRKEEKLKLGASWMPTSAFTLSLDGSFANDQYDASTLGMQNGHNATINLEGDYQLSATATTTVYATWQSMTSANLSQGTVKGFTAPNNTFNWVTGMKDEALTFGATFRKSGLLADKLTLSADISYSLDTTSTNTSIGAGGAAAATAAEATACTATGTAGYGCGSVPDIKTGITRLDLNGTYQLNKKSSIKVGYLFARFSSTDYMFLAEQMGYTATGVLPWNEQNPSLTQNAMYIQYMYAFQ